MDILSLDKIIDAYNDITGRSFVYYGTLIVLKSTCCKCKSVICKWVTIITLIKCSPFSDGLSAVRERTNRLTQYILFKMAAMSHKSGRPLVEFYGTKTTSTNLPHGPILSFNLKDIGGEYIGYAKVTNILIWDIW